VCEAAIMAIREAEQPGRKGVDAREFLIIPYCLGKLGSNHEQLMMVRQLD
jgi:hypothetical protein